MKLPFIDSLTNLVANLGTGRDKASSSYYSPHLLSDVQLADAYRYAWLPRKIVDCPPMDATRNWRGWVGSSAEIEAMEAEEKRLNLRGKVREAMVKARTLGGGAIVIGSAQDPEKPLTLASIPRGGIPYLLVMSRIDLIAGDIERDPMSPNYNRPKWYEARGAMGVKIHPSRVVRFIGAALPDESVTQGGLTQGWGDSVLTAVYAACRDFDSTMSNVASLVFESKVDVFKIPDFMRQVGNADYRAKVLQRTTLSATSKGINGALLMDKDEEYESKSASFGGLDAIIDRFMQVVSGAADIPLTRLMGVTSKGLGNTDLTNYYDRVRGMQELEIGPEMQILDECLIRSALGNRPSALHYEWRSLWQTTPKERADIGKTVAETIKIVADTKLFNSDALAKAAENAMVEAEALPGLEDAMGDQLEEPPAPVTVGDAAPQSLYVSRKVLNSAVIMAWAKEQGIAAQDDLHVTITYSRDPVDWMKIGTTWFGEADGKMSIAAGGPRMMDKFGDALVLLFNSWQLSSRHGEMREIGASWDRGDYQPHITIAYNSDKLPATITPYTGPIELGPEIFEPVDENWSEGKP
jgi:phage-related protein (TIGR01555 family)